MPRQACLALIVILCLCFLLGSCVTSKTNSTSAGDFTKLTEDFVYGNLALSPITATQAGYHMHQGVALDETLDDMGPSGIATQRSTFAGLQNRIAALDPKSLDKEQAADLEIMKSNIALSMLELDSIQSYKHNPTVYVEAAGNALFAPYVLNDAPLEKRFEQITKRRIAPPARRAAPPRLAWAGFSPQSQDMPDWNGGGAPRDQRDF